MSFPKSKSSFVLLIAISLAVLDPPLGAQQPGPRTVAEATDYKATSRHSDVLAFVRELQKMSPHVRVEQLAVSPEGRPIPLIVIGRPVPLSPAELAAGDRMTIYIQANIHAGEVEGKEASLMLARDILLADKYGYLDKLVLLIAPIFNADGNERISPEHRAYQPGPEQGVGVRANAQNLDLNRDAMKLESPELRGFVKNVLDRWDPQLVVDCHTTDGSYHEEPVTWAWPVIPNGDADLIRYQRETMLPEMNRILEEKYGTLGIPYGDPVDIRNPEKGWSSYEPQPRFLTNYVGLRNRLAILIENYVHSDFKTRVMGNYNFLRAILDYSSEHAGELVRMVREADLRTIRRGAAPSAADGFGVEFEPKALPKPVTIRGFETEIIERPGGGYPSIKNTGRKKTFTLPFFADYTTTKSVRFPFAYLIPVPDPEIVEKLLQHGLTIETLDEETLLEVETFRPKTVKVSESINQGHRLNVFKGEAVMETKTFPRGTIVVRTAQRLGSLAAALLEPEYDDGLAAWNFFDRYLWRQWSPEMNDYPVYKLLVPGNLVTTAGR